MKSKIASYLSIIGHPLLNIPLFACIAFFTHEEFPKALFHSSLILLGIALPIAVNLHIKSKNGTYTNFDVSDQKQRQSWYIFAILVLLTVTIILFVTDQSRGLRLAVLFSLILLAVSQLINYLVKCSLHVSFNILLSFLISPMNLVAGLLFLVFTILIAWSRITLNRHTMKEIIAGSIIGLAIEISYLFFI
ncbi:MAG TPA: hypothetical protein DCL77_10410 [Prolixibacteraceae bacterium]|jgi:hypothetical protein|nr:hypothetical protein [Prolixibacteraceae bacterium]